uniref:Glycosyl hydrolase family 31 C-terminal domain-containing protein n=1 Tax=Haptolina brevifila TaxID=156173 RepID=A0A7S2J457_9EUKA|mmetsp:Transcript_7643/g.15598  ORF Transcript_7643/g.15598 Transcript_7643/m.15598 type:complete len:206 (+) Transcript_7643:2-619(+)
MEKQFMAGGDLMVVPVTTQGATSVSVYFPGSEPWYDVADGARYEAPSEMSAFAAPIDKIPVFQRGGSIVPRQMRLRRSSVAMATDPFTLVVAADSAGYAAGKLFLDEGDGYSYRKGHYAYMRYELAGGALSSKPVPRVGDTPTYQAPNMLERVELMGMGVPKAVKIRHAGEERALEFTHVPATNRLVIRKPAVPMAAEWSIIIIS